MFAVFPLQAQGLVNTFPTDVFTYGVLLGGFLILAFYNISLFLTLRNYSPLIFLLHVIGIAVWLIVSSSEFSPLFGLDIQLFEYVYRTEFPLLFLLTSGLTQYLILRDENQPNWRKYQFPLASLLCGLLLVLLMPESMRVAQLSLLTCLYSGNLFLFILLARQENKIYSVVQSLCIFAQLIPGIFVLGELVTYLNSPESFTFSTTVFALVTLIQATLFTIAMNTVDRKRLKLEINEMTGDLVNNLDIIEEQNIRLDIARKEAESANKIKSRFIANISHEIRSPLNIIAGFSRELQSLEIDQKRKEQIDLISKSTEQLTSLVNDVLDFSQIEAGKLTINNEPYFPIRVIEESIEMYARAAQVKGLEFGFACINVPERLCGDKLRLQQIVNNLLSNAVKFTDYGEITLTIDGVDHGDGHFELLIKVKDTGIGISQKHRDELFQPFNQISDNLARTHQGSGLGLSICAELAKLLDGQITVSSELGIGSEFTLTLPQSYQPDAIDTNALLPFAGSEVLLIDPITSSRRATATLCAGLGMQVFAYEDLAMFAPERVKYDLVILALPQKYFASRSDTLEVLSHYSAEKLIILSSGSDPSIGSFQIAPKQFKLSLPLTISKLISTITIKQEFEQNPMQRRLANMPVLNILAVDDMPLNLKLLSTWLKHSPIKLTQVTRGSEAVEFCKKQGFDLILMDIQMPVMDGIEATKLIRKTPDNVGTPIIALTAHAFTEEREKFLNSGFDDFIAKPIDLNHLLDIMNLWCGQELGEDLEDDVNTKSSNIDKTKTLDWDLALKRANYNEKSAVHLLSEFVRLLPDIVNEICTHFDAQRNKECQATVHKLHGACCYTGVPKLQTLCAEIELNYRNKNLDPIAQQILGLKDEMKAVQSLTRTKLESLNS